MLLVAELSMIRVTRFWRSLTSYFVNFLNTLSIANKYKHPSCLILSKYHTITSITFKKHKLYIENTNKLKITVSHRDVPHRNWYPPLWPCLLVW